MESAVLFGSCVVRGLTHYLPLCQSSTQSRCKQVVTAFLPSADAYHALLDEAEQTAFLHPPEMVLPGDLLCSIFSDTSETPLHLLPSPNGVQYPCKAVATPVPDEPVSAWLDGLEKLGICDLNALMALTGRCLRYVPVRFAGEANCDLSVWQYALTLSSVASCLVHRDEYPVETHNATFVLYSLDLSGIQQFLYTISSKGALKGLRARSFYLSILMEHIADAVLDACGLTRMNVVYCGGGKAHLLLPHDKRLIDEAHAVVLECNRFFLAQFGTALYLSDGWSIGTAEAIRGCGRENHLGAMFRTASRMISERKSHRYDGEAYRALNQVHRTASEHECAICGSVHGLRQREDDWLCDFCYQLEQFSPMLTQARQVFTVCEASGEKTLPLPCGCFLHALSPEQATARMAGGGAKRLYAVHQDEVLPQSIDLLMGNYQPATTVTFEDLAGASQGIRRLAVLRADVDNLGDLFANGLVRHGKKNPFARVSLARYGALSGAISAFFQEEINRVVASQVPQYAITTSTGGEPLRRNVSIVYAGGDDLFLVGAWNEVLDAGMAVQEAFARYTGGQVTLSCGVSMEAEHTPIRLMANHSAVLEDAAKHMDGKDAVGLFEAASHASDGYVFKWVDLKKSVLSDMLPTLTASCANEQDSIANSFLYQLWELLRDRDIGPMRLPRLAYTLSRHTSGDKAVSDEFAKAMYRWASEKETGRALQAAILLYVYLHRTSD